MTSHRGRLGLALRGEGRARAWAPRIVVSVVVVALAAAFLMALWPFLTGRLVIVNEYPDLQEYVSIPGTGDTFTQQSAFIATSAVGGLVPYEPLRDKGRSPRLPTGTAVRLRWNSRLEKFLETRGQQSVYDVTRGAVVFIGDYSASDIVALKACAVGATERRRVDTFAMATRRRIDLIRAYPPAKLAFVQQSSAVLHLQYQAGFFFHHHTAFLAPLTAIQNGDWLARAPCAYGWLSTLLLGLLLRFAGGLEFSRYLQVSYFFYVAYAALFLVGVRYALRTWSARLLAVLVASGAFYMTGFWSLYLAPGFNPIRHLLDIACLLIFLKAVSKGRLSYWMLLALAVAVLQIAVSREFGAGLFVGVFTATLAYALWKPGRVGAHRLTLGGLAVGMVVVAAAVALLIPGADDSTARYLLMGVWVGPASSRLIVTLLALLLGGCAIFGFSRSEDRTRFGFMMWLVYLACLCIYYVWNPAPNHLWSLGSVIAMACALAVENVRSISGRWLASFLELAAICAVIVFLFVPGRAVYVAEHAAYESYVGSHRIFDWQLGVGNVRSTADPRLLAGDVSLIRDAEAGKRVFMISKYQDLLLFLAGKNTGFAWNDLMLALVTKKEADSAVEAIRREKPAVLFVDRDIARSHAGDIINSADPLVGWMQAASLQRVALLEDMSAVFARVRGDYRLARSGDLIDVYVRR